MGSDKKVTIVKESPDGSRRPLSGKESAGAEVAKDLERFSKHGKLKVGGQIVKKATK
jgi:hypothetical protein